MMKKVMALILAIAMCAVLAGCSAIVGTMGGSGNVTLTVMLMPQGDMNDDTVTRVTEAVNERIAELGHDFQVEFTWSGGAWGFERLDNALQTGVADLDIIPAHSWSGSVTYTVGAMTGQYIRLDDPDNNLLEQYGPALYGSTAPAVIAAATIPGDQGVGIYGYIIEKDSVQQLGYLVNVTALEEIGFSIADFNADDIASWEPILSAYKAANPNSFPLNVEAEVISRTVNHVAFTSSVLGPLGVVFDNANPAATPTLISSRYELPQYQDFLQVIHRYFQAGYIDPDQGIPGEISSINITNRRTEGEFLISTFAYAPGAELMVAESASLAQGRPIEIAWAPGWSSPIATAESAQGSGLAVYSGSNNVVESVIFLNMLASDEVIGNLLAEGIEGESFTITDGVAWRNEGRAGWNIWRYGVVGATSGATPLGDVEPNGDEWVNFRVFNNDAIALPTSGFVFDVAPIDAQYSAAVATIERFSIPLGSGAADPGQLADFLEELRAVGIDEILAEANRQLEEYMEQ